MRLAGSIIINRLIVLLSHCGYAQDARAMALAGMLPSVVPRFATFHRSTWHKSR
jgi:hypothetical protein